MDNVYMLVQRLFERFLDMHEPEQVRVLHAYDNIYITRFRSLSTGNRAKQAESGDTILFFKFAFETAQYFQCSIPLDHMATSLYFFRFACISDLMRSRNELILMNPSASA